jgi:cysteine desulfuration protein SufE
MSSFKVAAERLQAATQSRRQLAFIFCCRSWFIPDKYHAGHKARPTPHTCVTLAEKQQQMVDDFALIEDPQERLSAVVDRARSRPPLPEADRTEGNRVKGCVSLAWIAGEIREGRCHFRSDADSPLVRGLLLLICDLYSDATPAEVSTTEPTVLEQLGLAKNLSPTRLNGLRSVRAKIRDFATTQTGS